jgi:hypothetical protein
MEVPMEKNVRWLSVLALLLAIALLPLALIASETNTSELNTYASSALGIQFQFPAKFVTGRYRKLPELEQFDRAVVLAEPRILGEIKSDDIPVGEVPTISLIVQEGEKANFTLLNLCSAQYMTKIGDLTVYKLPGYPGPFGNQAYCYYVALPNQKVVEVTAHRFYFGDTAATNRPQTHYDTVIEDIIKSLRILRK